MDLSATMMYTIAAKWFIAMGKDGYDAFTQPGVVWLNDETSAMYVSDIII